MNILISPQSKILPLETKNKILNLLSQLFKFYHKSPKQLTRLKMLFNLVIVIDVSTVHGTRDRGSCVHKQLDFTATNLQKL